MKIDKSNALEFSNKFIKRAKALSDSVRLMLETEKKHKIKSNYDYKSDLAEIDKLILLANKSMKILKQTSPGYSFAEKSNIDSATISVDEFSVLMGEADLIIPNKLPEDRNELHKLILSVKEKKNVSYDKALQILRGKK